MTCGHFEVSFDAPPEAHSIKCSGRCSRPTGHPGGHACACDIAGPFMESADEASSHLIRWVQEGAKAALDLLAKARTHECDCPLNPYHRWNCELTPIWAQTIRDLDTNPWNIIRPHDLAMVDIRFAPFWVPGVFFRRPFSDDIVVTTDGGFMGPVQVMPGTPVEDRPPRWVTTFAESGPDINPAQTIDRGAAAQ